MVQDGTPRVPGTARNATPTGGLSVGGASVSDRRHCLLETSFVEGQVTDLRHEVGRLSAAAGLAAGPTDDLMLAVNEAMSNAVRHGGGGGTMRVWRNGDLIIEISDDGPGFDVASRTTWTTPPRPSPTGGLGLWLASQTSGTLSIESGPAGTTVRVSAPLSGPR
nr:ATP-binding protein [Micromonospora sp. DSM 115978]